MSADPLYIVSRCTEHDPGRADRLAEVVLGLLLDLTQQAARFGSSNTPWTHLSVYDPDAFASFTPGESA
ncbi:hypothetical protein ACKI1I_42560 [Streptomyces turgidiscabies]|uniref:hypothetical protein n=1 Tax=Streptomyces turgidiscabies TaxID=85558 RepID=UPI0038F7428F